MKNKHLMLGLALLWATLAAYGQQFDTQFQPFITRPGDVEKLRLLPDGGFIAAGSFTLANRQAEASVARFYADGALDLSFQATLPVSVRAMAVQPDGKIVIGGRRLDDPGAEGSSVIRLHVDGSLDESFAEVEIPAGSFSDLEVESNGTLLIGGSYTQINGVAAQGLARVGSDGQLLQTFTLSATGSVFVSDLITQPDGRFIVGGTRSGEGFVSYHLYSGQTVPGFQFSSNLPEPNNYMTSVRDIATLANGQIVLTASTFLIRYAVVVLQPDGSIQHSSDILGIPMALAVDPFDNILVAGQFDGVNAAHRYLPGQGLQLYSQGTGADGLLRQLAVDATGGYYLGGNFSTFNGQPALSLQRFNGFGQPVPGFNAQLERPGIVRSVLQYDDNRICIGGDFARVGDQPFINLARLMISDGSADPSFVNTGISYRNQVNDLSIDDQGRLLVAGTNDYDGDELTESPLLRVLPNGTLDPAFAPDPLPVGKVEDVQALSGGRVLAVGGFTVFDPGILANRAGLYLTDGQLDEAFSDRISGQPAAILQQQDGKLLLGGNNLRYDGSPAADLLRLTPSLERDPAFLPPAELQCLSGCRMSLAQEADGSLLIAGRLAMGADSSLVRLSENGTADAAFSLPASFGSEEEGEPYPYDIQPLADGRTLVAGNFNALGSTPLNGLALLQNDGSLYDALTQNGFDHQQFREILLLPEERWLLAGEISDQPGAMPQALAIAEPAGATADIGISGRIHAWFGPAMGQVEVALTGGATVSTVTDSSGQYQFSGLEAGQAYGVQPMQNSAAANGLSTLDLMPMSRHLLGIVPLDNPYQLLAADVNGSGSVTVSDMIAVQRIILGIADEFPGQDSWIFVPADHDFVNPANPWQDLPAPQLLIGNMPGSGVQGLDFIGVKLGDVNGSAQTQ